MINVSMEKYYYEEKSDMLGEMEAQYYVGVFVNDTNPPKSMIVHANNDYGYDTTYGDDSTNAENRGDVTSDGTSDGIGEGNSDDTDLVRFAVCDSSAEMYSLVGGKDNNVECSTAAGVLRQHIFYSPGRL
ncbi:hypothetical protein HPB50_017758 [Hyalomma asiaticum]|uniref:Uncharacterized protein n=1 Tax=Hyalomma asiaticum TaxID=266040 RepID=A0ACB7RPZ3_HYAAI|nr:hypothetical protein HPB50_017758 [Hyalomma asiaticum]